MRSLLAEGLLDQMSLNICPIVVGTGLRLFDGLTKQVSLRLVDSTRLRTGVIGVTYQAVYDEQGVAAAMSFPGAARD